MSNNENKNKNKNHPADKQTRDPELQEMLDSETNMSPVHVVPTRTRTRTLTTTTDGHHQPREFLTIIGMEDDGDLSTIANDYTVASIYNIRDQNQDQQTANSNSNSNSNIPKTPTKQDETSKSVDTQPETPQKSHFGDATTTRSFATSSTNRRRPSRCFLRTLFAAVLFGSILLAVIAVLSLNLYQLRNSDTDESSTSGSGSGSGSAALNNNNNNSPATEIPPFYDFSSLTDPPQEPEGTGTGTGTGSQADPEGSLTTTIPNTSTGTSTPSNNLRTTSTPTSSPTESPTMNRNEKSSLKDIIRQAAPYSDLDDESSIASQVLTWLVQDPSLPNYLREQIVQRFALGVLYWSLIPNDPNDITGGWMTYDEECTWESTRDFENNICNDQGVVEAIYLENRQLYGSLPREVGLLQGLKMFFLTSNDIEGSVPTELGLLTNLERLKLSRNLIQGSLPTEMGQLTTLGFLSIGSNRLTGSLPTELGRLTNLGTLGLPQNRLDGTIPTELVQLTRLKDLVLENNFLTGEVPVLNSDALELVQVGLNDLTGSIPDEICNQPSLVHITVDCEELVCTCCTDCPEFTITTPVEVPPGDGNDDGQVIQGDDDFAPIDDDGNGNGDDDGNFFGNLAGGAATDAPTECASLTVGEACYVADNRMVIDISYFNCDPREFDMIAMYPDLPDISITFRNAWFWVMGCGITDDKTCSGVFQDGRVFLENQPSEELGFSPWPFESGAYRLHLIRLVGNGDVESLAQSDSFRITADKNQC